MSVRQSRRFHFAARAAASLLLGVLVSACGGGGGSAGSSSGGGSTPPPPPPPPQSYTIGGSISGLSGSGLVLQDNGGDNLTVAASGKTFTFSTAIASGSKYAVTVLTQPSNPSQTCTVSNGSGTVGSANVTNVTVACTTNTTKTYTIGGSVSGLSGSGLVLQDNGGNNLAVSSGSKAFTFSTALASGSKYSVTVLTQPGNPSQTCTVSKGAGTVGSANVSNVAIACTTNTYTIGGSISGLTGSGLILQDNGGDNLSVPAAARVFTFSTRLASGSRYAVTVKTQPTNPNQTCTVSNGSGTVGAGNVATVAISCTTATYTVGGTVTGLTGTGLVLKNNGGNSLTVPPPNGSTTGTFTFSTALAAGSAYAVTVSTQPSGPAQLCSVANGSGTVGSSNVTNVQVSCVNVGRFVFVANNADGTQGDVSAFTIDSQSGFLTPVAGSPFLADVGPNGVVVDPTGQFVYVSNGSLDVSRMMLDPSGSLTLQGQFSTTASVPVGLAIAPSDAFLYTAGHGTVATGTIYGFSVNPVSGALIGVSSQPFGFNNPQLAIAIDPTSQLVFSVANPHFLFVNSVAADGTLTETAGSGTSTGNGVANLAVWPKGGATGGYVYTTNSIDNSVSVFSYDGQGNVTALATAAAGGGATGIAIDPTGKFAYVTNFTDGTLSSYSIDPQTGALTSLGAAVATGNLTAVSNPGPFDVKIDPSSQFLYCTNKNDGSVSLFTIGANGALTLVDTYASGLDGRGAGAIAIAVY